MSDRSLKMFLEKLDKELSKSSEIYRSDTSNKQTHDFGVVADELATNTIEQVRADGIALTEEDIEHLRGLAIEYYNDLRYLFTQGNDPSFVVMSDNHNEFRVIINPKMRKKKGAKRRSRSDVFRAITAKKQKAQDFFYRDIEDFYIANNAKFKRGSFLDVTHQDDSAVSKQQIKNVAEQLKAHPQAGKVTAAFERAQGIDLSVVRTEKTIRVSIGAAQTNRQEDGKGEQAVKNRYKGILKRAIKKLDIPNLEGSDSPKNQIRKKTARAVVAQFNKLDGVTVKVKEDLKPKKSSGKKVTKKIRPKVTSTPVPYENDIPEPKHKRPQESPINLKALVPVINQTLPEVVAANMGSPALNYQTGRFANSVEVTDITRTGKGYPSIGYTYMKDPYQLYEVPGGSPNLATPERDPRNVIGKSIREIATGLITERFYIRRG